MSGNKEGKINGLPPIHKDEDDPRLEAARTRLRQCVDQADALEAIREIVANLLGCEEMALFKVDKEKAALWLFWSFGVDPHQHGMLDALSEPALQLVIKGEPYIDSAVKSVKLAKLKVPVSAFIPISFQGNTVAVLALYRLLTQKLGIDSSDVALFRVLSGEAGSALFGEKKSFVARMLEENL